MFLEEKESDLWVQDGSPGESMLPQRLCVLGLGALRDRTCLISRQHARCARTSSEPIGFSLALNYFWRLVCLEVPRMSRTRLYCYPELFP